MTEAARHLEGHVPPGHALSLRRALEQGVPFAKYEPLDLWEQDTHALPSALAHYRRRMRMFAQRHLAPHALRLDLASYAHDVAHDAQHREDLLDVLREGARAGLLDDTLPWPFGSKPLSMFRYSLQLQTAIKMEELCAACGGLGLLLGAHVLGCAPILLSGDLGSVWRHLLPAYRRSRRGKPTLLAFAITEPASGSDVEESRGAAATKPGTVARRVHGGYRISGRKVFISGGDLAEGITLFSALGGEGLASWTCFYVRRGSEGFKVARTELKMGQRASGAAELELDDVFVPDKDVVGKPRTGWGLNRITLNFSRMPVGAIALGIARGAMEAALEFACRETLGGKPLIHFQEVQLQVAQMIAETSAMRALIWQSAAPFTPTQAKASITKFQCGDRAVAVCDMAMDLLGNHALLHSQRVEKAFRDARLTQIYEGTNQINRLAVIEDLQEHLLARLPAGD